MAWLQGVGRRYGCRGEAPDTQWVFRRARLSIGYVLESCRRPNGVAAGCWEALRLPGRGTGYSVGVPPGAVAMSGSAPRPGGIVGRCRSSSSHSLHSIPPPTLSLPLSLSPLSLPPPSLPPLLFLMAVQGPRWARCLMEA